MSLFRARPFFSRFFSRPRWVTWRLARRSLLGCATLTTLIALAYGVENWRGRRAWAEVRRDAVAKGLPVTRDAYQVAAIPDEENTFAAPIFRSFISKTASAETQTMRLPYEEERWCLGGRADDGSDLNAWRVRVGKDDLVAAFAPHSEDLMAIERACELPRAELPLGESFFPGMDLDALFTAGKLISLRARVYLDAGRPEPAARDIRTLLRLARKLSQTSRATVLTALVGQALTNDAQVLMLSGIKARAWDARTLEELDTELGRFDGIAVFRNALRGELSLTLIILSNQAKARALLSEEMTEHDAGSIGISILRELWVAVPSGWFLQNGERIYRLNMDEQIPAFDPVARQVDLDRWDEAALKVNTARSHPYWFIIARTQKHMRPMARNYVDTLQQFDLTRVTCRLERHRLTTGIYPKSLDELAEPPERDGLHNLLNGDAYIYRLTADGANYKLETKRTDGTPMRLE